MLPREQVAGNLAAATICYDNLLPLQMAAYDAATPADRQTARDELLAAVAFERATLVHAVDAAAKQAAAAAATAGWSGGRAGAMPATMVNGAGSRWSRDTRALRMVAIAPFSFGLPPHRKVVTLQQKREAVGVARATLLAFDASQPGVVRSSVIVVHPAAHANGASYANTAVAAAAGKKQQHRAEEWEQKEAEAARLERHTIFDPVWYWRGIEERIARLFKEALNARVVSIEDIRNKARSAAFVKLCPPPPLCPSTSRRARISQSRTPKKRRKKRLVVGAFVRAGGGKPISLRKHSGRRAAAKDAALQAINVSTAPAAASYNGPVSAAAMQPTLDEERAGLPVLLFHGTASRNIKSIQDDGLRVPYTGQSPISVANGSAYGVGVYTAKDPSVSNYYTQGCKQMFICAGLSAKASYNVGNIVVFQKQELVLPCYLVRYT